MRPRRARPRRLSVKPTSVKLERSVVLSSRPRYAAMRILGWMDAYHQLADSMKRFNYLLGQTELFQHFVDLKVCPPHSAQSNSHRSSVTPSLRPCSISSWLLRLPKERKRLRKFRNTGGI